MLISKTTKIKWNSKIKKHYEDLGYIYTKMGDEFEVNTNDLSVGSRAIVEYECDYCHKRKTIEWQLYYRKRNKNNLHTDCCRDCIQIKAKESIYDKYGTYNVRNVNEINEKIKQTNLIKYGCDNPFGNKKVQEKIKQYYKDNFGVEHNMQLEECVKKSQQTQLEKYGTKNYGGLWSKQHAGELSPVWIGEKVKHERSERQTPEYRDWRKSVFSRDLYTCQKCKAKNGNGKYIRLEVHHIFNWNDYPEMRYDKENGITLCQDCHMNFHSIYGKKNNTKEQLEEFLNKKDKKIC